MILSFVSRLPFDVPKSMGEKVTLESRREGRKERFREYLSGAKFLFTPRNISTLQHLISMLFLLRRMLQKMLEIKEKLPSYYSSI